MRIDPVVVLMAKLQGTYQLLGRARDGKDWESTRRHLATIASLHGRLRETEPSSVIGAAHLLREAAALLLRSNTPYHGDQMREMAMRLCDGERHISDLVWLRGVFRALVSGQCGRSGENAAPLVALALKGAARPALLDREVLPQPSPEAAPRRSETRA